MPSCAGFIEHSKSRLGPLKFAFNAENFVRSFSMLWCLSQLISAQFALEMCLAVRNRQKNPQKPLFWRSRSSKVIEFGGNWLFISVFKIFFYLLVINSDPGPISHPYWDTATHWLKFAKKISTFLSFNALVWGDPLWIYRKALRFLQLKSFRQPTVKIWHF